MKRLISLATALLLTGLLAMPALSASTGQTDQSQGNVQLQKSNKGKGQLPPDSEGRRLHKAYFQKREAMKQRRDEEMKVRDSHLLQNTPGNTGF